MGNEKIMTPARKSRLQNKKMITIMDVVEDQKAEAKQLGVDINDELYTQLGLKGSTTILQRAEAVEAYLATKRNNTKALVGTLKALETKVQKVVDNTGLSGWKGAAKTVQKAVKEVIGDKKDETLWSKYMVLRAQGRYDEAADFYAENEKQMDETRVIIRRM